MTTAKATYLGDLRIECEHLQSGVKIVTDAPMDNRGRGEAFSPTDLCATSLAACMMTIMGIYAGERGIDIKGAEIEITKKMETAPRRIAGVDIIFNMPARKYSDKDKKAMEAAARTCPVYYSLNESVVKNVKFIWRD